MFQRISVQQKNLAVTEVKNNSVTVNDIAKKYGVSNSSIYKWIKNHEKINSSYSCSLNENSFPQKTSIIINVSKDISLNIPAKLGPIWIAELIRRIS